MLLQNKDTLVDVMPPMSATSRAFLSHMDTLRPAATSGLQDPIPPQKAKRARELLPQAECMT